MHEGRHKKTSLEKYIPLTLFVRFACERCWRPNINIIFWPHCYDRHVVSCSPDVGVHSIGAFRGSLSVVCGLHYHIWSLLSGSLLATASGVFRVPPRSGVAFPTTSGLYCLDLSRQLLWDPNSTELNNNSTPTRSPTGSLNRMFNRHQAEITVMQFRGHSLPLHDCNGRMEPWPCPIS